MTHYHVIIGLAGLFCIGLAVLSPTRHNGQHHTADNSGLSIGNLVLWAMLITFIGLLAVVAVS